MKEIKGIYTQFKAQIKLDEERNKYSYYCPNCGHTVKMYGFEHIDKKICSWCGYYVYKDKEKQKKYDFKRKLKKLLV